MKKYKFIVLIGVLVLFSCKKKDIIQRNTFNELFSWQDSPCDQENSGNYSMDIAEGINYRYPVFNPDNQLEFIYYEYEYHAATSIFSNHKLVKYSILTSEKKVILSGKEIAGPVAWNKNGELAFIESNNSYGNIYTMNDDGSNLKLQLTCSPTRIPYLKWSADGSQFCWLYINQISSNNTVNYLLKKKINEPTIDSILVDTEVYSMDISSKNELLNFTGNGYYEMISLSDEIPTVSLSQAEPFMFLNYGLGFSPDGNKFYASIMKNYGFNVYEFDISKNTVSKLLNGCKEAYVHYINVSPSGNHILMEKRGIMESNHPYEIYIFDLNTKKEALVIGS